MKDEQRDRSEGWKHAKMSGHQNETLVEELIEGDEDLQRRLLKSFGKNDAKVKEIYFEGLNEKNVSSVLETGGTTRSKTDVYLVLDDGSKCNISIKKSLGGQVYLIKVERFLRGFELHYGVEIPARVKRAFSLFWGSASDTKAIVEEIDGAHRAYEMRKCRLVANSLAEYDEDLHKGLLDWFDDNMSNVLDFCFSRGLARNEEDWADIVWYKNQLHEHSIDRIFSVEKLCAGPFTPAEYGNTGGGTTIQLPFGFVQWHQESMQFHHKFEKVAEIVKSDD